MFVTVPSIDTTLSKIHRAVEIFFIQIDKVDVFDKDSILFPLWLRRIDQRVIFDRFSDVFIEYKQLAPIQQINLKQSFFEINRIKNICSDSLYFINFYDACQTNIKSALIALFEHLYNNSLSKSTGIHSAIGDNPHSFYRRYFEAAGEVCLMCGLETVTTPTFKNRSAFDHWLYKDKYYMCSVNMSNIVPIGHDCNSGGACKSTKDILNLGADQDPYYPYENLGGININITIISEPQSIGEDLECSINVTPNDISKINKFNSWCYLFNIKERYDGYLRSAVLITWRKKLFNYLDQMTITRINNEKHLRKILRDWSRTFNSENVGGLLYASFGLSLANTSSSAWVNAFAERINNR